jgi:hypothetical protein
MKIKRIQLSNFRGIESLDLDFTGPDGQPLDTVVLAGPNGCGKTSVLEACLIGCGSAGLIGQKAESTSDVRLGADRFILRPELQFADTSVHTTITSQNLLAHQLFVEGQARQGREWTRIEYFSSWREPKLIGSVPVTAGNKEGRPKPSQQNRLALVKQHLVNLTARRALGSPEQRQQVDPGPDPLVRMNEGWRLFYPGRTQRFVVKPAGVDIDEGFDLFLEDDSSDYNLPVDALSSGELEVLTMLGWFATRDLSEAVLLIDEPELHLHPAWHRTIMRALRVVLPQTQIICATHSPEVLDSVYSYERFTLLPFEDPRIRLVTGPDRVEVLAA